jgi:hypothetical protein
MALLEPVNTPNDQEAAQDAPRGMLTMYVDTRSGQAYVTGSVNNIHNLTAVTLNAVSAVLDVTAHFSLVWGHDVSPVVEYV